MMKEVSSIYPKKMEIVTFRVFGSHCCQSIVEFIDSGLNYYFWGTFNEYKTKSDSLDEQHDSSIKYQFGEYDWEKAVVNEPSKAELLEQIEVLKFQLAQAKRQLKKKSYQASVYSKMMQIAMRRLPDEWFPFKDFSSEVYIPIQRYRR